MPEDILDPAHADDSDRGEVVVAGIASPDAKDGEKPEPKVSDDGNIVELGGKKYITFDALAAERKSRQELAETLARLDPVMPEFEEFLKTKNNRRQSVRDTVANSGEKDDEDYLSEVATALGFYNEQNEPDLRRAQAHLNITRRESKRVAQREVEPVAKSSRSELARANRERARSNKFVDGRPVADQQYIDAALDALGDEHLADPNVANMVQVVAAGLEYLDQRKNGTNRGARRSNSREPMFVERGSGRFDGDDGELSPMEQAAARARGKTPEQWAKLSKQVNNSDRRNSSILEEV